MHSPVGSLGFFGVAATSTRNAWAVGQAATGTAPLILRWNGKAWKRVRSPAAGHNLTEADAQPSRYDLEVEKDRLGDALDGIRPLAAAS